MMYKRIDHIAIAVKNLDEAVKQYGEVLGLKVDRFGTMPEQSIKQAFITLENSFIELMEPTDPQSAVGRFLESRGEGIYLVAVEVDDQEATIKSLLDKGVRLIGHDAPPSPKKQVFVHPKFTNGVLLQINQKQ
jgi:methylmalonyl-CoA/ethylmalonyl-CoA epimerase